MNMQYEKNGSIAFLSIGGEMTIEHAGDLRDSLLTALSDADQMVLDVRDVSSCDLSVLQVFCAAHRSAVSLGKQIAIAQSDDKAFRRAVAAAGYWRHVGCPVDADHSCLWVDRQ